MTEPISRSLTDVIMHVMHVSYLLLLQGGPEVAKFCAEHVAEVLLNTEGASFFPMAPSAICRVCGLYRPNNP